MKTRFTAPAIILIILATHCAAAQLSDGEREALRQRYGVDVGRERSAPATGAAKILQDRTKNLPKPAPAPAVGKVAGEVLRWVSPGTVVVREKFVGPVWVQTSETVEYTRADPMTQVGLFVGGSGGVPPPRVVAKEGYYENRTQIRDITVDGVAQASVKAGDKVAWRVEWVGEPRRARLVGIEKQPVQAKSKVPASTRAK